VSTHIEQYREIARWTRFVLDLAFAEGFEPKTGDEKRLVKYARRLSDVCNEQFAALLGLEVCNGQPCLLEIARDERGHGCHTYRGSYCRGCTGKEYLTGWQERYVTLYRKGPGHHPIVLVAEFSDPLSDEVTVQSSVSITRFAAVGGESWGYGSCRG
jgi:hypothetical protein